MNYKIRQYKDTEEIVALVRGFQSQKIPHAEWNHATHATIGYWYVHEYPLEEAITALIEGINLLNAAHAAEREMEPKKCHVTITIFWCRMLKLFQEKHRLSLLEGRNAFLASKFNSKPLIREYYDIETIKSDEARHGWVEPKQALEL